MDQNRKRTAAALGFATLAAGIAAGPAAAQPASFTTLSGKTPLGTMTFAAPACPTGEQFLVSHLQASPEVMNPPSGFLSSLSDNVRWAVSVILSPQGGATTSTAPLTAIGRGVVHLETSIPAGQALPPPGTKVKVNVRLLDSWIATSTQGGMFNIHVTGFCGTP